MTVRFPGAVAFVADFPVLDAQAPREIRIRHPIRGLLRRAGAVVDRDEHLRVEAPGDVGKRVEAGRPSPGIAEARVGLPMIFIGK